MAEPFEWETGMDRWAEDRQLAFRTWRVHMKDGSLVDVTGHFIQNEAAHVAVYTVEMSGRQVIRDLIGFDSFTRVEEITPLAIRIEQDKLAERQRRGKPTPVSTFDKSVN